MERILITGASGNVGRAILRNFHPRAGQALYAATRDRNSAVPDSLYFDLEDPTGTEKTLARIDTLFLLRPPHIADVKKYFHPIIDMAQRKGVRHLLFLSVQGAEKLSFIPHAKIEKRIVESGLRFTFFRPSYFMDNLTTTLMGDIRSLDRIFLPAGEAKFLWIGAEDIGKSISAVLIDVSAHAGKAYTLTGTGLLGFAEVADMLSLATGRRIRYVSPNLLKFYREKRRQGLERPLIAVMALLHFLPRFQASPSLSADVEKLTGQKPGTLERFIAAHATCWDR